MFPHYIWWGAWPFGEKGNRLPEPKQSSSEITQCSSKPHAHKATIEAFVVKVDTRHLDLCVMSHTHVSPPRCKIIATALSGKGGLNYVQLTTNHTSHVCCLPVVLVMLRHNKTNSCCEIMQEAEAISLRPPHYLNSVFTIFVLSCKSLLPETSWWIRRLLCSPELQLVSACSLQRACAVAQRSRCMKMRLLSRARVRGVLPSMRSAHRSIRRQRPAGVESRACWEWNRAVKRCGRLSCRLFRCCCFRLREWSELLLLATSKISKPAIIAPCLMQLERIWRKEVKHLFLLAQ